MEGSPVRTTAAAPLPYALLLARLVSVHEEGDANGHSLRVASLAERLLEMLDPPPEGSSLWPAALLVHDVGKLALPPSLLRKPNALSLEEHGLVRMHTMVGRDWLHALAQAHSPDSLERAFWGLAAHVAGGHHERPDGKGYPLGLGGDAVTPARRFARLLDVYDSLRHRRAYRDGLPHREAVAVMRDIGGFDEPLLSLLDEVGAAIAY